MQDIPKKTSKFFQLWLIIGIFAGFAAVVFFSITYLNEKVLCNVDCRIQNEVSLALILMSLFGMFIGSLTYYFISEKYEKRITKMHKDASLTLKFLEGQEKSIMQSIINNKGKTTQSKLVDDTRLSRVKISRILKRLIDRKIILKKPNGMTNIIELDDELKKLFFE